MSTLEKFLNAADIDIDNLENNRALLNKDKQSTDNNVIFQNYLFSS
jgi:hypothetical protein